MPPVKMPPVRWWVGCRCGDPDDHPYLAKPNLAMNQPLHTLGIPPNAWTVDATNADLSRPPIAPRSIILPTATKTLRLDLNKSALLVIDMQNDFCHPAGWLAHIGVDKYRMSGFWDTPLDSILRNLGKTTLFFTGVNADQCVMATPRMRVAWAMTAFCSVMARRRHPPISVCRPPSIT
ncbi:isochorismatase family protein [Trichothermofontia sp.]